jgi:hypothetical protein
MLTRQGRFLAEKEGFVALHRRIVAAYRLRMLGSAVSLLWAVSLR